MGCIFIYIIYNRAFCFGGYFGGLVGQFLDFHTDPRDPMHQNDILCDILKQLTQFAPILLYRFAKLLFNEPFIMLKHIENGLNTGFVNCV